MDRDRRLYKTNASKVMLPVYAALNLLIGVTFLIQQPSRTSSPAFTPAKATLQWLPDLATPMQWWGLIFSLVGGLMLLALKRNSHDEAVAALILGAGVAMFWSVLLFAAAIDDPHVSFTGGYWVLGIVAAHIASTIAVRRG